MLGGPDAVRDETKSQPKASPFSFLSSIRLPPFTLLAS